MSDEANKHYRKNMTEILVHAKTLPMRPGDAISELVRSHAFSRDVAAQLLVQVVNHGGIDQAIKAWDY